MENQEKSLNETKQPEVQTDNAESVSVSTQTVMANNDLQPQEDDKKEKKPSRIELKDKSELFKNIIDVALACEKLEEDRKKLKNKVKNLSEEIKDLKEEKEELKGQLEAIDLLYKKRKEENEQLQSDINHRNEVIQIQKADKVESSQEFKNALAASLKTYMQDFEELKAMDMSEDVGYAIAETLDGVFKTLGKNGINI